MQNLKNTATEHTGTGQVAHQAAGVIKVDECTETEAKPQCSRLKKQNNHSLHYTQWLDPHIQGVK